MKKLMVVLCLIVFVSPVLADEPVELLSTHPLRPATAIYIPSLEMYWPVELLLFDKVTGTWPARHATYQAMHFQGTGSPGENGNVVLAGHRTLLNGTPGPFFHLNDLHVGDSVYVYDGKKWHEYVVTESFVVDETAKWVVAPTENVMLTLLTCHNMIDGVYIERLIYRCESNE